MELPLLAVRGDVLFPKSIVRLEFGRARSVTTLNRAMGFPGAVADHTSVRKAAVAVFTQRNPGVELPARDDLYDVGCLVNIIDGFFLSGRWHVELHPVERVRLLRLTEGESSTSVLVDPMVAEWPADASSLTPLCDGIRMRARQLLESRPSTAAGAADLIDALEPEDLVGVLGSGLELGTEVAQGILAAAHVGTQLRLLLAALDVSLKT